MASRGIIRKEVKKTLKRPKSKVKPRVKPVSRSVLGEDRMNQMRDRIKAGKAKKKAKGERIRSKLKEKVAKGRPALNRYLDQKPKVKEVEAPARRRIRKPIRKPKIGTPGSEIRHPTKRPKRRPGTGIGRPGIGKGRPGMDSGVASGRLPGRGRTNAPPPGSEIRTPTKRPVRRPGTGTGRPGLINPGQIVRGRIPGRGRTNAPPPGTPGSGARPPEIRHPTKKPSVRRPMPGPGIRNPGQVASGRLPGRGRTNAPPPGSGGAPPVADKFTPVKPKR